MCRPSVFNVSLNFFFYDVSSKNLKLLLYTTVWDLLVVSFFLILIDDGFSGSSFDTWLKKLATTVIMPILAAGATQI